MPDHSAPDVPSSLRAKKRVNRALAGITGGYELRRIPRTKLGPQLELPPEPTTPEELAERQKLVRPGDRLVEAPGFVLSSVRSGSTLLRLMLNSHPEVCAPHELHLRRIDVTIGGTSRYALQQLGVDGEQLRFLAWDRLLHRELTRAGKRQFVNKTPNDSMIWADIAACWPDARFVFLQRHPKAILDSWFLARSYIHTYEETASDVYAYCAGMEQARQVCGGLVMRYEDLTAEPERETRRLCEFLGLEWTPAMLAYGDREHQGLKRGLGDWSDKMRSGRVQQATPAVDPHNLPEVLRPVAREWGYRL